MSVALEPPSIIQVRQDLESWLNKDQWTFQELRRWLKGYELPSLGYESEPYVWILRSLPKSAIYRQKLANRIAKFLEQTQAHATPSQDYNDSFFYNLLHVCAGLGCKKELGKQLSKLFFFFTSHPDKQECFFSPSKSYNLNNAFREALITNQLDSTFSDVWKAGLEGKQVSFLLLDHYSCFRGIVYVSHNDQPAIEDIGWSLGKMAEYLEPERDRHQKFRRLLERVKEVWPPETINEDWDRILLLQSLKNNWRPWATVRLKKLAVPKSIDAGDHLLVWSVYLPFLRESRIPLEEVSTEYLFSEISIQPESLRDLQDLLSGIEVARVSAPFRSYQGVVQATNEFFYMNLLEDEDTDKEALEEVRINTFTLVANNPEESGEKQVAAQRALAHTAAASRT